MKRNKPIRILFDANPIAISGKSGIGHYSYFLIQSLADAYPNDIELVGHYYNFLGRRTITDLPQAANITYRPTILFPGKVTNVLRRFGFRLPFELLAKTRGDVLLFPNFLTLPSLFKTPTIVAVHDLCYIAHPEYLSERNLHDLIKYVPQSVKSAALVVTISEFTKTSLQQAYDLPDNKIVLTPVPPFNKLEVTDLQAKKHITKIGINKNYVLFVGNLEPRKNLTALVSAYTQLPKSVYSKFSLVLAGGKGWKNEDLLAQITQAQAEGFDIIMPGYISDEQKAALYQGASLVVLPSHYEGFGMPVLEAFQYGIPTALSDIPVLHEVAEDAAFYFDKDNPTLIAQVLTEALTNNSARENIIAQEPSILAKYSWADNAQRLYKRVQEL